MGDLILYLGLAAVGYIIGAKAVRGSREKFKWTGKAQTAALITLVVFMGMRMGANREIVDDLSLIGLSSLIFTAIVLGVCVVCLFLVRKAMGIDRYGSVASKSEPKSDVRPEGTAASDLPSGEASGKQKKKPVINMMTVYIVISVACGMALGFFLVLRMVEGGVWFGGNIKAFDGFAGTVIKVGLCILLLFVGLDLGVDGTVFKGIRDAGLRILAIPATVLIATLLGALICAPILKLTIRESLAIGAGFGWYTLAPGLIMEAGLVKASAISFMHNVLREITCILLIPAVAQSIGYVEAAAMPGAPAMDVCLPVVARATKPDTVVYAFVSGVITSFLVPVLVPLILAL